MKMTGQSINDVRSTTMVNTEAIAKLEMQMGQLANHNHMGERDKGKFPSQPVTNLRYLQLEILQVRRTSRSMCRRLSH